MAALLLITAVFQPNGIEFTANSPAAGPVVQPDGSFDWDILELPYTANPEYPLDLDVDPRDGSLWLAYSTLDPSGVAICQKPTGGDWECDVIWTEVVTNASIDIHYRNNAYRVGLAYVHGTHLVSQELIYRYRVCPLSENCQWSEPDAAHQSWYEPDEGFLTQDVEYMILKHRNDSSPVILFAYDALPVDVVTIKYVTKGSYVIDNCAGVAENWACFSVGPDIFDDSYFTISMDLDEENLLHILHPRYGFDLFYAIRETAQFDSCQDHLAHCGPFESIFAGELFSTAIRQLPPEGKNSPVHMVISDEEGIYFVEPMIGGNCFYNPALDENMFQCSLIETNNRGFVDLSVINHFPLVAYQDTDDYSNAIAQIALPADYAPGLRANCMNGAWHCDLVDDGGLEKHSVGAGIAVEVGADGAIYAAYIDEDAGRVRVARSVTQSQPDPTQTPTSPAPTTTDQPPPAPTATGQPPAPTDTPVPGVTPGPTLNPREDPRFDHWLYLPALSR